MAVNVKEHVCPFAHCDKSYSKLCHLDSHVNSHDGMFPFKCDYEDCDKQYRRNDHLTRHVAQDHNPDFKEWSCPESDCEMHFKTEQNLKKHILRRHTRDRFKCRVPGCGQAFRKHRQLKVHSVEHSQDLPYRCTAPGCDKAFPLPSKLARHAKVHKGYLCDHEGCDVKCDKWTELRRHKLLEHCSEFACNVCKKKFSQKQWLKQHMQTHDDKRPMFACTYEGCSREYIDKRNLNNHIRSYHEGKRFPCELEDCEQTFATKQKQLQHQKLHSSTKLPPKKKKRKLHAEKALGISIDTESRGQDSDLTLKSPEQDRIHLPDLPDESSDTKDDIKVLPKKFGTFVDHRIIEDTSTETESETCVKDSCVSSVETSEECKDTGINISMIECKKVLEHSCTQLSFCPVVKGVSFGTTVGLETGQKRKHSEITVCAIGKNIIKNEAETASSALKKSCVEMSNITEDGGTKVVIDANSGTSEGQKESCSTISVKAVVHKSV